MADNRKEQERTELHRTIWNIANDLRGSVDGWDFKQYVLGMLFYRYISENLTDYINRGEHEAGNREFNYAKLTDNEAEEARMDLVHTKGFFILPSELFENVRKKAAGDENLNETIGKAFRNIESSAQGAPSEDDFKGLFDDIDVNSNKLGSTVAKRNEKFVKVTNSNKLTPANIRTILTAYAERADKDHFTKLVSNSEIAAQGYNLSVSAYVEQKDTREVINIVALNAEIEEIVAREQVLRDEIAKIIAEIEVGA